jgi:quinol monooxygenase YgiN
MRSSFHFALAVAAAMIAAAPAARAQNAPDQTIYVLRYIEVTPSAKNQAVDLLKKLTEESRKDDGVVRFEVLQRLAPAGQYTTFEVWKDQKALDAHAAAAHTKQFQEAMAPLLLAPIDDRLCIATDAAPAQPAGARAVYVVTHVDVAPPNRDANIVLLKAVAAASRKENGNIAYDALQQTARTNHFEVVEVWKDKKASDAHEASQSTKDFRAKVQPLLGAHYDRRWYRPL